jgi:hypothetical protein
MSQMVQAGPASLRDLARRPYSRWLTEPQFADVEGFVREAARLPRARLVGFTRDGFVADDGRVVEPRRVEGRQIVTNATTGEDFAVVSPGYQLIQHSETVDPLIEGLRASGVRFCGSIWPSGGRDWNPDRRGFGAPGGKVSGMVLFKDPAFEVELPSVGDRLGIGFEFQNSIDASMRFSAGGFALNVRCTNGMMMPQELGVLEVVHVGKDWNPDQVVAKYEQLVAHILKHASAIPGIVDKSLAVDVDPADIERLLYGADLPKTHAEKIAKGYAGDYLVGPQRDLGHTAWRVYSAATYYYSNEYVGTPMRARELLGRSNAVVRTPLERLFAAADARDERERDANERRKEREEQGLVVRGGRSTDLTEAAAPIASEGGDGATAVNFRLKG